MRIVMGIILLAGLLVNECQRAVCQPGKTMDIETFGISYAALDHNQAHGYDLLIVEPGHFDASTVDSLQQRADRVVAYLSLGEVYSSRWYYPLLRERGLLGKNPNWSSYFLNLADSTTRAVLVDSVVPEILKNGYDGLFLDTVDNVAPATERSHLQDDMLTVIKSIRERYPDIYIIQNAGLFLVERTAPYVDALLVENVAAGYRFDRKRYYLKEETAYREKVETSRRIAKRYDLPLMIVDFADSDSLRQLIRTRLDTLSVPYFISPIELDSLPVFPTVNSH